MLLKQKMRMWYNLRKHTKKRNKYKLKNKVSVLYYIEKRAGN